MGKLAAGDEAPDFQLPDQPGITAKLAPFRGRKLLWFFPPTPQPPLRVLAAQNQACPD
jgi:peroxiredoxin